MGRLRSLGAVARPLRPPGRGPWPVGPAGTSAQIYVGPEKEAYIPAEYRPVTARLPQERIISSFSKRSRIATYAGKTAPERLPSNL